MRAAVLHETADIDSDPLRIAKVENPLPRAGEVRIKVNSCAVCRTDLHVIEGDLPAQRCPVIPGHQIVGVVDSVGEGCTRLTVGQRIGIAWLRSTDGTCRLCCAGRENLCEASLYTGYHEDGGYAEYALVNEEFAYELPEDIDDVLAAPLLCAGIIGYRALQRAEVPDGGRLLLVGFGSSAHIVIQLAVHRGHEVFVATRSEQHGRHAEQLGAAWAGPDLSHVSALVDSAILFAPAGDLVPPVMERLRPAGTLAIAGIHLSDIPPLNYQRQLFHEKQIRSVEANTREDGRRLLAEAAAAGVRPDVAEYGLADANRALQDLKHGRIRGTGVLIPG